MVELLLSEKAGLFVFVNFAIFQVDMLIACISFISCPVQLGRILLEGRETRKLEYCLNGFGPVHFLLSCQKV